MAKTLGFFSVLQEWSQTVTNYTSLQIVICRFSFFLCFFFLFCRFAIKKKTWPGLKTRKQTQVKPKSHMKRTQNCNRKQELIITWTSVKRRFDSSTKSQFGSRHRFYSTKSKNLTLRLSWTDNSYFNYVASIFKMRLNLRNIKFKPFHLKPKTQILNSWTFNCWKKLK